jgi:hypothetical protein
MHDGMGSIKPLSEFRTSSQQVALPFVIDLSGPARLIEASESQLQPPCSTK